MVDAKTMELTHARLYTMNKYPIEELLLSNQRQKLVEINLNLFTCSVSTKFATAPSSLTPRTLNLVPARSQLNLYLQYQRSVEQKNFKTYLDINHKSIPSFL